MTLTDARPTTLQTDPEIVHIDSMHLCGLARSFDMLSRVAGIPALWQEFAPRMAEVSNRIGTQTYGACISAGGNDGTFRYQAAVQSSADATVPDGFEMVLVPEGDYAVFRHHGPAAEIKDSMQYIWTVWLPDNGSWQHRSAPDYEFYDDRFDSMTGTGIMEIYVPVSGIS